MFNCRNFLLGKRKYVFGLLLLSLISVICVVFRSEDSDDFNLARREVLLRRIGHQIFLQSGDSISRVLPVKEIAKNEYLISFENDITSQPDSLIYTTSRFLDQAPFAGNYIVNVLNCSNSSVAYGYAIGKNKKDNIVACVGRKQPKACYMITIKFKPTTLNIAKNGYLLGSLSFLGFLGFIFFRSFKPQKALSYREHNHMITLGSAVFDAINKKIIVKGNTIDLTGKETRLLLIFALSPNEIIEKSRIQKELWEDEGVIVGRSLDMFISKLRKKLEFDPNIKIAVVRGKGYRLEISQYEIG